MKKSILIILMLFFGTSAYSQSESDSLKQVYCQIIGTAKILSNKVTIEIDFGQQIGYFKDNRLRDEETGKVKAFNSMIDALNYMAAKGWEFQQAYTITIDSGMTRQNVYHYLLKRKII